MSRATLNDLVEDFLRLELGYGEEIVVTNEVGPLYDVEETDNLEKKLSELGIRGDSVLTVIDEDDENPRVNLIINVQESPSATDDKPIKPVDAQPGGEKPIFNIPRRRKSTGNPAARENGAIENSNGSNGANGKRKPHDDLEATGFSKKRSASGPVAEDGPIAKRGKVAAAAGPAADDDLIIVDDAPDGAILIDDD